MNKTTGEKGLHVSDYLQGCIYSLGVRVKIEKDSFYNVQIEWHIVIIFGASSSLLATYG